MQPILQRAKYKQFWRLSLFQTGFWLFHGAVFAYAIILLTLAIAPAFAQSVQQFQITEHERRITSIESLTMSLDHRLTVIETLLNDLQSGTLLNRMTMGGTALLIAERAIAVMRKKGGA